MIRPFDAWVLGRVLVGRPPNCDLQAVSAPLRALAERLAASPPEGRMEAWEGFLAGQDDREEIVLALAAADPDGPAPRNYATLADIDRIVSTQAWLWPGWIPGGVLGCLAAEPGTGKTRFAMDLARRLYHKLDWPDGKANELPERTRTLWVQGDRNFAEMLQVARDFGIPEEAVALGATPDDPCGGLDLDDPDALAALAERIRDADPALAVIDTVGMTTSRNLCRPEEARAFFAPLIEVATGTGVSLLALTHLSANKEALGRRIVEKARVVIKMTCPDPGGQPNRRRLWVDKTAIQKPSPLGVTMGDGGNEYDFTPPTEPVAAPHKPGPSPAKLDACKSWLSARLTSDTASLSEVREDAKKAGFTAGTLYRARDDLDVEEYEVGGRKWWSLPTREDDSDVQDEIDF